MKIGSLFSGYGGLDLAVEAVTGAQPAWFCEFDPAPSKVLAYHWPDVPNHKDVTQIDWAEVEHVDILTGGSPCQDLSHAGKRAGMTEGTRSNLWVNMREAINHLRPKLVVWENVLGALSAPAESESDAATSNMEQGGGDYWQRPQEDIFGHSVAYSETLPKSGTTRNGQLYERPISAHPTTAPASSSSHGRALPTPRAMDAHGSMTAPAARKHVESGYGTLPEVLGAQMFPTPKAGDGMMGRPRTSGRPIEKSTHLTTIVTLLPTPVTNDGIKERNNPSQARRKSPPLSALSQLLPTPNATMGDRGHASTVGGKRPSGAQRQVDLNTVVVHFPTPNASDGSGGGQHPSKRVGHSRQLIDTVLELTGDDTPPLFDVGNEQ